MKSSFDRARALADEIIDICHVLGDPHAADCVQVGIEHLARTVQINALREERDAWGGSQELLPPEAGDAAPGDD